MSSPQHGSGEPLTACTPVKDPEELALRLMDQDRVERSQVLDLINLLPREEPHSASCGSAFYTGAYRKGGIVGLRTACQRFPASAEVLAKYVRQEQPSAIFSSIAVLDNVPSGYHRDVANAHCDNHVFQISNFSGGAVWCEQAQGADVRSVNGQSVPGQVLTFSNHKLRLPAYKALHATEPWSGSRIVLVSYCLQRMASLSPPDAAHLLQLGFQPDFATGDLQGSFENTPATHSFDNQAPKPALTSKPLILELCAGTAGLSAALKEIGFDAIAFDHKRLPGAKASIQVADLCSEHGFSLAKKILLHPRCVGCFAAPVCGTASRAREITSVSGPSPLRSEDEPDGLTDLSPSNQLRVQRANTLYHAISDLVLVAASRGLVVVLENPRRSLYWRTSAFVRIKHLFSFTAFQNCAYGSPRDKWTALAFTSSHHAFATLNRACPGTACRATHLEWGHSVSSSNGFATSVESAYPTSLCKALAHVFARVCPPGVAAEPLPLHTIQSAVAQQPKASRTPMLVPEHKHLIPLCLPASAQLPVLLRGRIKEPWPIPLTASASMSELPVDSQLLRINALPDKGGVAFNEVVWGVPWNPEEFLCKALESGHPRTIEAAIPQVLQEAILQHKSWTPEKIAKARAMFFAKWLKVAQDLQAEEFKLKESMSQERRKILQPKRLLVWRAMLHEANYSDMGVVEETTKGTDLVGEAPATGVFNAKFRPARRTVEDLVSSAPAIREAIIQSVRSQGHDVDVEVLRQTQAEVEKGWATGPIKVEDLPPKSLVSRRFGLVQPNKTRLIDDLSASGINDTVRAEETPTPHTIDVAAGMITSAMRHLPGQRHMGRAYDLVSAYRQLAVSDTSKWASYVALWNHQSSNVSVYALHALPFGASRSVFSFLRVIHSVWHLGAFFLWLIWSCYYDDLISISDADHTGFTHRTIDAFFTLLGWAYAKDGAKSQAYSESFSALGVCFVLSNMHLGRVTICNTEKRIRQLLESIRGFLASGTMTVQEALKLRGQLQFACGQVLGRQFRIFLNTLTDYAYGDHPPTLPPMCIAALENFSWMLEFAGPRAINVDSQKPLFIFTDACYNPHDDWVCGIGGMLFNSRGQLLAGFSHELEARDRAQLGEGSCDTIIMAAEFVAVSCATLTWRDQLRNAPVVLFIDNNSCRDVLISAKGRSPLMRKLLSHYLKNEHEVGFTPWVARVPSPSNCSDAPSRRKFSRITWKNQSVACTDVKAALEAVLECLQTDKLG